MHREEVRRAFDDLLQPHAFKDYGPNGLQVEGKSEIRVLVSGVTASRALIEAAIDRHADAIVVHHGLFWRGQSGCVTGWLRQRLALLLAHDINLFAYHLPLDAHPEVGNNAELARLLGLNVEQRIGEQQLVCVGRPVQGAFADASALAARVERVLERSVTLIDGGGGPIERLAWCSGGAQGYFEAAIEAGAQAYLTGELSEPQTHLARESRVSFLACGHHATERYGVRAAADRIAAQCGLEHMPIDIDNPA